MLTRSHLGCKLALLGRANWAATVVAAVVGTALLLLVPTAATAADSSTSSQAAFLRTAHLSPDTPGVDIYVSATGKTPTVIRSETYGHFSSYVSVTPGSYSVAARLAGSPASSPVVVSWHLQLAAGDAYTAAAIGSGSERKATLLHDDLTPPASGKARVRLIQAASTASGADVTANGTVPIASNAAFATTSGYVQVPAGTWPLSARATGASPQSTIASVSLPAGSITTVVLLDEADAGLHLISTLDSAGAGVMPRTGINTGGGGLAPCGSGAHPTMLGLLGWLCAAVAALAWRRRSAASR